MNLHAAPAWSLKGTRSKLSELQAHTGSPGPMYNLSQLNKTSSSSFKIGKSNRVQVNQGVDKAGPGPADYQKPNEKGNGINFGKQKRNSVKVDDDPDAFTYENSVTFVKARQPSYTMGSKYPSSIDEGQNKHPGPGQYISKELIKSQILTQKRSKFGTGPRFSDPNTKVPGVGDYNVITESPQKSKGTLSKSRRSLGNINTPGPSDYLVTDFLVRKGLGMTIGEKGKGCFQQKTFTQKAFINYLRNPEANKVKTFSVGKSKRQFYNLNGLPGPGQYKSTIFALNKKTGVSFARSSYPTEGNQNPGPGTYENNENKTKKHTISKSKSYQKLDTTPGAGRYNPEIANKLRYRQNSSHIIGRSHRQNFVSKNIAGVGDYNIQNQKKSGISIPKAQRFPQKNKNPGPGDYHLHSTISNFNLYNKKG